MFKKGNTAAKPASSSNIGWNVGKQPVGPPPAYPGLANKPVSTMNNAPPAYSPSFSNPPAYNPNMGRQPAYNPSYPGSPSSYSNPNYAARPGNNAPPYNPNSNPNTYQRPNTFSNTHAANPNYNTRNTYGGYNSQPSHNPGYGNTFGQQGLGGNTYISNNYYGGGGSGYGGYGGYGGGYRSGGGSGFLTYALLYGAGMHHGHSMGSRRSWDREDDRRWRETTKAPYFENKVPGEFRNPFEALNMRVKA
jgi:hypothetical protein